MYFITFLGKCYLETKELEDDYMLFDDCVLVPKNIWNESIDHIKELEQKVDYLQKALECRPKKAKVKVCGRSPMDKVLHRYVR